MRRNATVEVGGFMGTYDAVVASQPCLCEDCGNVSDLGHKCRACYARWKRELWRDIPSALRELVDLSKTLNRIQGDQERCLLADMALGHEGGRLAGEQAQLLLRIRSCQGGPFGNQLDAKLQAIRSAGQDAARRRRGGEEW